MISVVYNDNKYNVKNKLEEILIGEFEDIIEIMNSDRNYIDRWSEILFILGLPKDVIDDMSSEDFINIIRNINIDINDEVDVTSELDIDGVKYKLKSNKLEISVKDMRYIEDLIVKSNNKYIANILAVLYKNENSDNNINYDLSHIKYKAKLIRENITVEKSIPFIKYLSKKIVKDFNLIQNEFNGTE